MAERERRILRLVGLRGTIDILRHLDRHGTGQYTDFAQYANVPTLNTRLKQLLEFNLITHHLEKKELRKEWYELTEKGRKVLQSLEDIIILVEILDTNLF